MGENLLVFGWKFKDMLWNKIKQQFSLKFIEICTQVSRILLQKFNNLLQHFPICLSPKLLFRCRLHLSRKIDIHQILKTIFFVLLLLNPPFSVNEVLIAVCVLSRTCHNLNSKWQTRAKATSIVSIRYELLNFIAMSEWRFEGKWGKIKV